MKTAGIICECNPMHEGHRYLLQCAKANGAEAVVCVMSGNFVQRGEPAVFRAEVRARILCENGADLVLELPFPFCSAGAEFFAKAGISVLSALGVDELWFGSECGDAERLSRLADIADGADFQKRYAAGIRSEQGTAERYVRLLSEAEPHEIDPVGSNDLLAIAYLRAIRALHANLIPHTVRRQGAAYRSAEVSETEYPSSTALRRQLLANTSEHSVIELPLIGAEYLDKERKKGSAPADWRYAERLILGKFRLWSKEPTEQIAELSGGLGARMCAVSHQVGTLESFLATAGTKKYPRARLQRGILFALTDVAPEDLRRTPAYTRLLCSTKQGYAFLASVRNSCKIPIVTRAADYPTGECAALQRIMEQRAEALYALCLPSISYRSTDRTCKRAICGMPADRSEKT